MESTEFQGPNTCFTPHTGNESKEGKKKGKGGKKLKKELASAKKRADKAEKRVAKLEKKFYRQKVDSEYTKEIHELELKVCEAQAEQRACEKILEKLLSRFSPQMLPELPSHMIEGRFESIGD